MTTLIRTDYNDILVVHNQLEACNKNTLIPFIDKKIIKNINTNDKLIIVKWNKIVHSK